MTHVSSSSKVLGVRVPLPLYMEILQKATENKLTITDYVLQIILSNKSNESVKVMPLENWQAVQQTFKDTRKENEELKEKYESCMTEGKKIFAENKILRKDIEDKDKLLSALRKEIKYLRLNQKDKS